MNPAHTSISFLDISPIVRYAHHLCKATPDNHIIPWRYIYDYEFIFVVQGCLEVQTKNETYVLHANDIHIMSPRVWHRRCIPDGQSCNYYSIHFDFLSLGSENDFSPEEVYISQCNRHNHDTAPVDEKLIRRPLYVLGNIELPKKLQVSASITYIEILKRIVESYTEKPFAYEIDIKADMLKLLKQILNDVRSHVISNDHTSKHLASIAQFVLDNYQTSVDFKQLCHIYGYSYENFRKLFKRHSGKTPNEFLTDVRIQKAVEFLYTKQYSITEIAFMVGYSDSSYFSRLFRKHKGVSPSEFVSTQPDIPRESPSHTNIDTKEVDDV